MLDRIKASFDPYILALIATIGLASLLPAHGAFAQICDSIANGAIVLLFFLHGAKLSREAIVAGAGHWRLHLATLASTFVLFPLLGLGLSHIPGLPVLVASGMLFLTLLPSTVQSSIAFTSIARGNVAAAVCSASFSNLAGIFITPLLVTLFMGSSGASMSFAAGEKIVLQLLVPFIVGHLVRPWLGGFLTRHKGVIGYVDRGSILMVVYTAFSAAVMEGLWSKLPLWEMGLIFALSAALLALVLAATWGLGGMLGFERADRIVLLFCGSKKSLASGVPMAGVLFAPSQVGVVILPLMLFHQVQLMACAVIARQFAQTPDE